jgi:hypothetical protein
MQDGVDIRVGHGQRQHGMERKPLGEQRDRLGLLFARQDDNPCLEGLLAQAGENDMSGGPCVNKFRNRLRKHAPHPQGLVQRLGLVTLGETPNQSC